MSAQQLMETPLVLMGLILTHVPVLNSILGPTVKQVSFHHHNYNCRKNYKVDVLSITNNISLAIDFCDPNPCWYPLNGDNITAPCNGFIGGYTCDCPGRCLQTRICYPKLFQPEQRVKTAMKILMIVLSMGRVFAMKLT